MLYTFFRIIYNTYKINLLNLKMSVILILHPSLNRENKSQIFIEIRMNAAHKTEND